MSINSLNMGRSLLLLSVVPVLFACSKSKFSAVKQQQVPVVQVQQPVPEIPVYQQPQVPVDPYVDNGGVNTCNGGCNPQPPVYNPPVYNPPVEQPPQDCVDQEYEIPEYKGPRALNVWVVMDGSKSNERERYSQLLSLITMYEKNIARKMPITLSVITGHSRESRYSVLSGQTLFYRHSSEPAVLRLEPGMSADNRNRVIRSLEAKIMNMHTDNSNGVSDGGELLVANLYAALSSENLARAASMGAYGSGNILNIHFVGDENDICTKGQVEDYDKLPSGQSREDYARERNCGHLNVNAQGYSQTLFDRLKSINDSGNAQVHVTGFIYTNNSTIPRSGARDENEVGHGMLELINATNGKAYDLALLGSQQNQETGATSLAQHINVSSELYPSIKLDEELSLARIDRHRTAVYVDGQQVSYRTDSRANTMYLYGCPMDGRRVRIHYCRQPQ